MTEMRPPITISRILDRTRTVCSPPIIYTLLNDAIGHPRTSIDDISRIVNDDQGLTVRLLKLANSPLFGYFAKIDTISRAVTIVGTQQLRDLALTASIMSSFKSIPEDLMNMAMFWRHSIACGIFARNLAIYLRESNVERFFVAGMLHDVGQLVLCSTTPETVANLLATSTCEQALHHQTERRALGFDHADLGGALLEHWKLPHNIAEPVACHHSPTNARRFPLESAVVHLAEIFCQALDFGFTGERYVTPLQNSAWERLNIPVNMLETIVQQSVPHIEETYQILSEGH